MRPPGWEGGLALLVLTASAVVLLSPGAVAGLGSTAIAVTVSGMLPWAAGRAWARRSTVLRAEQQEVGELRKRRRAEDEQELLRERARLAEEVHDGLGHDLTLIALRVGALELDATLAEEHRRSLGDLRARTGAAVERLGTVVGLLRDGYGREHPAGPAESVDTLVGTARESGLRVSLQRDGTGSADPVIRTVLGQVVRESLTNAARHAPGAPVQVHERWTPDQVVLTVTNPASTAGADHPGGGTGLCTLRERTALVGGSWAAGPSGSDFQVRAVLPLVVSTPGPGAAQRTGLHTTPVPVEDLRALQRRTRRRLAGLVVLPVAATVGLVGVVELATQVAVARSVLADADFQRAQLGQPREAVPLPAHEAPRAADDPGCRYFAVTADPLADASGELYRLCFVDGVLVSKDVV